MYSATNIAFLHNEKSVLCIDRLSSKEIVALLAESAEKKQFSAIFPIPLAGGLGIFVSTLGPTGGRCGLLVRAGKIQEYGGGAKAKAVCDGFLLKAHRKL